MANIENNYLLDSDLDLYRLLGVTSDASITEIRTKYKELTRLYHPDKAKTEKEREINTKIFEKVKLAYQVLTDNDLRDQYTHLLQNTYESLKGDYMERPLAVERCENFNIDDFNKTFSKDNKVDQKTNEFEKTTAKNNNISFEDYKKQRDSVIVENRFESGLHLAEIRAQSANIYNQLSTGIQICNDIEYKYTDNVEISLPNDKTLGSLLNQFGYIRDNIENNPIICIDFIIACKKLPDNITFDKDLVELLNQKLDYKEAEWNNTGMMPFSEGDNDGHPVDNGGSLLN